MSALRWNVLPRMCHGRRWKVGMSAVSSQDGASAGAEPVKGPTIPTVSFRRCRVWLSAGVFFLSVALANKYT